MPVSISNIPARSNSDNMPVTEEYDLLWGFYTFSQTVSYEYDDIGLSGLSSTTITINGCFTRNAEGLSNSNCDDITSSNKLFTKYYNLRKKLLSTVNKPCPSVLSQIGTQSDERCVELPDKLKDNLGGKIYAIPVSFSTTEISPQILKYTVQLKEPQKVPCKIKIEDNIINNATISIVCRKPRIKYRTMAFSSGSEAYVTGVDNRVYYISGSIPLHSPRPSYDFLTVASNSDSDSDSDSSSNFEIKQDIVDIINSIIEKDEGKVKFGIERNGTSSNSNSLCVMVTEHDISIDFTNGIVDISISGEESSLSNSGSGL